MLYHASGIPNRLKVNGKHHKKAGHHAEESDDDESSAEPLEQLRAAMNSPLDFEPGTDSRYSNSGYIVARMILEAGAGQEYVPFVTEKVFPSMGITSAVMEKEEPVPNETCRYVVGPKGRHAPGRNPINWLFTAPEMVKFLTSVAGNRGEPYLSKRMMHAMTAKPKPPIASQSGEHHVGLGWDSVTSTPNGPGFKKNGGKNGVSAYAEHRPDGISWAFMINTNGDNEYDGKSPFEVIKKRINEEIDAQAAWPSMDLFEA